MQSVQLQKARSKVHLPRNPGRGLTESLGVSNVVSKVSCNRFRKAFYCLMSGRAMTPPFLRYWVESDECWQCRDGCDGNRSCGKWSVESLWMKWDIKKERVKRRVWLGIHIRRKTGQAIPRFGVYCLTILTFLEKTRIGESGRESNRGDGFACFGSFSVFS